MSMERSTGLRKGTDKGKVGGLVQHTSNLSDLKKKKEITIWSLS